MGMRIGVDFDGTLTLPRIQELVAKVVQDGHDVFCVTGRTGRTYRGMNNDDLHDICDKVGIKVYQRMFCGDQYWEVGKKYDFYLDMSKKGVIFDIHIDNNKDELDAIRQADLGIKLINVEEQKFEEKWKIATHQT